MHKHQTLLTVLAVLYCLEQAFQPTLHFSKFEGEKVPTLEPLMGDGEDPDSENPQWNPG